MNLVESLLDVLALIGIILTGGFLVFFLGDLLLSVLDPSYGSIFKRRKKQDQKTEEKEQEKTKTVEPTPVAEPTPVVEQAPVVEPTPVAETVETRTEEAVVVNNQDEEEKITLNDFENLNEFDDNKALEEQQMLEGSTAFSIDNAMAELKSEEERFRQEQLAQALSRQQEKSNEFVEDEEKDAKEEEEFDLNNLFVEEDEENEEYDLGDFNLDEEDEEENLGDLTTVDQVTTEEDTVEEENETVEEETSNEEVEETTEEVEETETTEDVEEDAESDESTNVLMAEIERLKAELEKVKAEKPADVEVKTVVNNMTEEECLEKLEELKARLKANEKEFKQAKKEYLPLNRIMKTLDNDKKKLRRKEAIVAKQKVVLYGVNNMVDIDQEKAQKLAEELDLLDGLRLSVQHCEEVINNNQERIPLLEKNYRILLQENNNIKADIANMEDLLGKIQAVKEEQENTTETTTDTDDSENN